MNDSLTLLDTDILIFILQLNEKAIQQSQEYQLRHGRLKLSELTYYECLRGYKSSGSRKKMKIFQEIVNEMDVIPLDKLIFDKASDIYVKLREIGQPTGEFDILIASTALVNKISLTTNNTKDYLNIKKHFNLKLQNWI